MKKVLMLLVAMAAMLPASMSAYDFKEGDIYYNVDGNEAAVTFEIEGVGSYSGDVVIPETVVHNGVEYAVTAIGYKAFLNCYNMTSIEIPNSIDSISSHAFRSCEKLQSVVIPNSVVTLYPCAFHSCTGLKSVVIGNSVRVIDEYCFQYCYQLTDVVIGSSVEYLGIKAFYDCYSLRDVTCLATTPPAMYEWYSFYDYNYENVTVHVPASAMDAYKADQYWGMFNQYVSLTMATGLTLDKSLVSLNGGEQVQLTATVEPADAISAVEWTTSNSNVATVNSNGMVTAVGSGDAVITAATLDGSGLTAQCVVLVGQTGIKEMNAAVRIYAQGEDIVVETPVEMPVEFIMTNGMSRTVTAKAGVNVYPAGHGIHIVRAAGQVAKIKI